MAQIEIKDLSFKYKMTDDYSLKNVSLKIEKGDFVAVCGKTGCGKTTLIKSLKPDIMPAGEKKGQVIFQPIFAPIRFFQWTFGRFRIFPITTSRTT